MDRKYRKLIKIKADSLKNKEILSLWEIKRRSY